MALIVLQGPIIRAGESLSEALDCSAGDLLRVTMPLEWDEAPLSFQISSTDSNYNDAFHLTGFEVVVPVVVANTGIIVPVDVSRAIGWIKFRSGTRIKPVPQSAERLFRVAISTYTGKPSDGTPAPVTREKA
jgi:hypothetical protein